MQQRGPRDLAPRHKLPLRVRDELRVAAFRRHGLSAKLVVKASSLSRAIASSIPSSTPLRFPHFLRRSHQCVRQPGGDAAGS
jgi:hypothetical protein